MKPKDYLCSYWYERERWSLTLRADGWADAEARCRKLGLTLDGEVMAVIPAKVGWLARAAVAVRNWWKAL